MMETNSAAQGNGAPTDIESFMVSRGGGSRGGVPRQGQGGGQEVAKGREVA